VIRLIAIQPPLLTPYIEIAVWAYSEQVGINLHEGGVKGEITLRYMFIQANAAFPGSDFAVVIFFDIVNLLILKICSVLFSLVYLCGTWCFE
jgi:hypothetical protein